jgi:signal transduction histidine kinase
MNAVGQPKPSTFLINGIIALAYLVTASLGLSLALEQTNATAVWPPTGIALAACLMYGSRIWPGIFAGAFLANGFALASGATVSAPLLLVSAGVAVGNTLEALVGAYLVRRCMVSDHPGDRAHDTVCFILLGAFVSPLISASIGTASFCAYGGDWSRSGQVWLTWWLGDAVGALIFAPLVLSWAKRRHLSWNLQRTVEAVCLCCLFVLVELIVFRWGLPLEYLIFPALFWTAFRFGQLETAVTVALVMVSFLFWTIQGFGPFVGKSLNSSLLLLQSYLGVASASTLLLSTLISTRRQAEDRLREYQDNLEKVVQSRTAELQDANERLTREIVDRAEAERKLEVAKERAEMADQIKSAFLATMSHELRTPLNSIIGFTGILLQGLGGPINEEQTKQLTMVKNSASHLLSLISDVLDISKIEAGQLNVVCTPVDLRATILKVVQSVRPLAEKKGLLLTCSVAEAVHLASADERRVEQILLNLLSNAVKFTDQGSVAVTCDREAGYYLVSVTDTGIGIKQDELDRLFKPFHQVDNGISRKYEGTGLGLSICMRLAELMGGTVGVLSVYGSGSTFWFRLPVAQADVQGEVVWGAQGNDEHSQHPAGQGMRADGAATLQAIAPPPDRDWQEMVPICDQLAALLRSDDIGAGDLFSAHRDLFKAWFVQEVSSIEGAIRRFDYETALELLVTATRNARSHT